jgi:peptidoglycan/LPS O-acetylase OafA/YrhL
VDIFFVISGFLITGHILGDLKRESFSFATFYARRTKRIFPAVAVMLLLNLFASYIAFSRQKDVAHVCEATIFSIFSVANFFYSFWVEHGYFSAETELDPLVHLWSLGVEEQFYLILPLILFLLYQSRYLGHVVALMIVSSFVLSQMMLSVFPMFSYYMLPARMGEMLLGSSIVIFDLPRIVKKFEGVSAFVGMVMVVVPMWLYDDLSPFPGWRALPPTVGTALIIAARNKKLESVLAYEPFQLLGLGSYSLYLYHWPFMAFLRLARVSFAGSQGVAILFLCGVFAYVSYQLVETPTRLLKMSNKRIFVIMFLTPFLIILILSLGLAQFGGESPAVVVSSSGSKGNSDLMKIPLFPYEKEIMTAKDRWTKDLCFYSYFIVPFADLRQCLIADKTVRRKSKPKVLVWGDSHAFHYVGLLQEFAAHQKASFVHSCMAACPPMLNLQMLYHTNPLCDGFNKFMFKNMVDYEWIILAARWSYHQFGPEHINGLLKQIREKNPNCKIIILGETPYFPKFTLKSCPEVATKEMNCDSTSDISWYEEQKQNLGYNRVVEMAAFNHSQVYYYDANDWMCPQGKCTCYDSDGVNLFMDDTHFSYRGSRILGRKIIGTTRRVPNIFENAFPRI